MKPDKLYGYGYNKNTKILAHTRQNIIGENLSFEGAEAYKMLRTNLIFSMSGDEKCKVVGVTSALRGEGKSTTAINIAYAIAETQRKVLLVEADMRIPVAAGMLDLEGKPGLSHVLAGLNTLEETIVESVLLPSMSVLPAGKTPPNPSELLSSDRMRKIVKTLSERFDYIIVDLPPAAFSDGLVISDLLSGMLVVVRKDYCDRQSLAETMRQLKFLNTKVLGFVVNDAESKAKHYGKYKYKYGYGEMTQQEKAN